MQLDPVSVAYGIALGIPLGLVIEWRLRAVAHARYTRWTSARRRKRIVRG